MWGKRVYAYLFNYELFNPVFAIVEKARALRDAYVYGVIIGICVISRIFGRKIKIHVFSHFNPSFFFWPSRTRSFHFQHLKIFHLGKISFP